MSSGTSKELLAKYEQNLINSENKNHYAGYAKKFLDYADNLDKETIDSYMKKLTREKKSAGTINFAFRVIRRLFAVNELDWPYSQGQAPQISERDEYKPALDPEIIKLMIEATKDGRLDDDSAYFLALSTIYGLRRGEMVELKSGDIDFASGTIFISTLKNGRQRYHLIPMEIKPYLERRNFERQYDLTQVSQVFWRIINKSGLEALRTNGLKLGWHSIRRSLLAGLMDNGLNPFAARVFLRWKGVTGELAMPARYYASTVIGLKGNKVVSEEAKGDKEVFEKYHPFLKFWG